MLKIFVNTWGNYNRNGAAYGRWINLPMEENELNEELSRIAQAMGDPDPEFCIHDYEWSGELDYDIGEYDNIHEINRFIETVASLDRWDLEVFSAAVEAYGDEVDPENLDGYGFIPGVANDSDLGWYWLHESGCYDLKKMGNLANYIDYEAFGRDVRLESDGGCYVRGGYIEKR